MGAESDPNADADATAIEPSVRTTFRRTLIFAAICMPAVFASSFIIQVIIHSIGAETLRAFMDVMGRWYEGSIGGNVGPAAPLGIIAFSVGSAPYFVLMGILFRQPKVGAAVSGCLVLSGIVGLTVPVLLPYAPFACILGMWLGQGFVVLPPVQRMEKLGVIRILRHFRIKNVLWLVLSMGVVFYYLLIMGFFVAAEELIRPLFREAGVGPYFGYFVDPVGFQATQGFPMAHILFSSVLGAALAFYHVLSSAYGVNQLDYLVDRGKEPIVQREFWWPYLSQEEA